MLDSGPRDGGQPCTSDAECDDGIACTVDACAIDNFCRHLIDPTVCNDGVFCNGMERCDLNLGCTPPLMRETCDDDTVCTIDRCDEATDMCMHSPRDLDLDGDPDWFCPGGGDCDDLDPLVNSGINEVCADFVDNNCDEMVDESPCGAPPNDVCSDPLDVGTGGFFLMNLAGTALDYTTSCSASFPTRRRDVVASFTLGERRSVRIEAEGDGFTVDVGLRTECTNSASEIACESQLPAVLRRRALEPGTYYIILASYGSGEVALDVSFGPPMDPLANDTCVSPTDVSAGGRFDGSFVEAGDDVSTSCGFGGAPDVIYTFSTTEDRDVQVTAQSVTGESLAFSVQASCTDPPTLRCSFGAPATGLVHTLPAGTYFIIVEGPEFIDPDFTLDVAFLPPTAIPDGDVCGNPLPLTSGTPLNGTFADKQHDVAVTCTPPYRDAIHTFTLDEPSDVTATLDAGAYAALELRSTCTDDASEMRCSAGDPVLVRYRNLAAGTYYLVAKSSWASNYVLSIEIAPPTTVVDVSGNENCGNAYVMPASGGLFRGNTMAMANDYTTALCGATATSPDAAFRLNLTASSRVIASTDSSAYDTVLHVHNNMCVERSETYCEDDSGFGTGELFDRVLASGTWFFVVDGFGSGSSGEYLFEVTVGPAP